MMTLLISRRSTRAALRLLGIISLSLALSACGLTAPRSNDGYADLESLGMRDTDNVMTLSIGPALLHFAASHVEDDPEVRELLKGLDGVRIRIYEINGDAGKVATRMDDMSRHLQEDGWEAVVINLMGEIQPQQFGDVMLALDVDTPGIEDVQITPSEEI